MSASVPILHASSSSILRGISISLLIGAKLVVVVVPGILLVVDVVLLSSLVLAVSISFVDVRLFSKLCDMQVGSKYSLILNAFVLALVLILLVPVPLTPNELLTIVILPLLHPPAQYMMIMFYKLYQQII